MYTVISNTSEFCQFGIGFYWLTNLLVNKIQCQIDRDHGLASNITVNMPWYDVNDDDGKDDGVSIYFKGLRREHGGALVESIAFNRRDVGSTPALAAM